MAAEKSELQRQHIILFYKYHPLSNDKDITAIYRNALEKLCRSLSLKGRILVGHSESEGINGTLAGDDEKNVRAFTYALLGEQRTQNIPDAKEILDSRRKEIIQTFWKDSRGFFEKIGKPVLEMNSPEDFKWSRSQGSDPLFPDLNIKLVKELIGTGGVMSSIPLEETAKGYLTPKEWHSELSKISAGNDKDTILIDCRNTKEFEIGHFEAALDPKTTTFAQFPKWVDEHKHVLADKKVLMYCTGGKFENPFYCAFLWGDADHVHSLYVILEILIQYRHLQVFDAKRRLRIFVARFPMRKQYSI